MATITVRIPNELKKRMSLFSDVNWSEVVRAALSERVELEFRRRRVRDVEKVKEASAIAGRIFETLLSTYGKISYNSAELIRQWRDAGWNTS
ncbi:MAG: hypothetical protein AOA65_1984 [Candidatus Bathyarchaeota archaeon BA1]|nr:MAG: hypothetical protein AOA65_1984 [Candidatus Bathyarchaeota archaeon BA1]